MLSKSALWGALVVWSKRAKGGLGYMREDESYAQMGGSGGEKFYGSSDELCSLFGGLDQ